MKRKKRKMEFKKIITSSVVFTYFVGFVVGLYCVIKDTTQLYSFLIYVGAPTTGTILSYSYVVRAENAIKLKRLYPEETKDYSIDLNNTNI